MKRNFFYYFGMVMGLVYIASGSLILFVGADWKIFADKPPVTRYVLGAILIAYGIFRLGKQQFQQRNNDYNDQILDEDERS